MSKPKDILIQKGKTYSNEIRWAIEPIVRKPITAISFASGAPRLTVTSHGITDGWECAVTLVDTPKQINSVNTPPRDSDYHRATVIDPNTIEFNTMTPVDDNGRAWSAYTSGGFIQYYTAQDLAGYTARMSIKDKIGGTVLLSSLATHAPLDKITLTVDNAAKKTSMVIQATDTAALTFKTGVADLEMVSATGVVTKLKITSSGEDEDPEPVRVAGEVTT